MRGIGDDPITAASVDDGVIAFMNAAFGLRCEDFFALLAAGFFAGAFLALSCGGFWRRIFGGGFFAGFFVAFR